MNQEKPKKVCQVFYNNRWVDKNNFRAFVYNGSEQKLAESYKEYEDLIASGLWFSKKDQTIVNQPKVSKARKPKDGADS